MTEPLVPPEVSLRGLPWMRLDTERMLNSDLFALATGDEFKAAVALWCRSWSQLPAGSLPPDDRILAALSGAGRRWSRVKAMALRGWVEASDGRLYHPVVAEQVLAAWKERQAYLEAKDADAERKRHEREERSRMFEAVKAAGHKPAWNIRTAALRELFESVTDLSQGLPPDIRDLSPAKDGTGRDGKSSSSDTSARTGVSEGSADELARALHGVGFPDCSATLPDLVEAKREGVTGEELAAIALANAGKPLAYVIATARGRRADAVQRAATRGEAPKVAIDPKIRAESEARHALDSDVIDAEHAYRLGVISEAERDDRIAAARSRFAAATDHTAAAAGGRTVHA